MSSKRAERGLSVRWRLTLIYTAVAAASAAVLLAGVYSLVSIEDVAVVPVDGSGPDPQFPPVLPRPEEEVIRESATFAVEETLDELRLFSLLGLVVMAVVSLVVGWAFAGRALRPVHTITSRARQISADSLDERLRIQGPQDELREMAETFDSLLDRIQTAFESERRLVATMSHELRTPLANQRAALDVALADPSADADALRQAGEVALGQTERAQRTVDALLTLARVQAGVDSPRLDPVALDQVTRAAVEAARDEDEILGLSWEVSLDPATVPGDAELLARAVGNLLQNAVLHNVPDGWGPGQRGQRDPRGRQQRTGPRPRHRRRPHPALPARHRRPDVVRARHRPRADDRPGGGRAPPCRPAAHRACGRRAGGPARPPACRASPSYLRFSWY